MNTYKLTELRNDFFKSTKQKIFIYLNIAILIFDVFCYIFNIEAPKWNIALWYLAIIIILSQLLIFCCSPLIQLNELLKVTIENCELPTATVDDKKWAIGNAETCYNDSTCGLCCISIILKDIVFLIFNIVGIIRCPWWADIILVILTLGICLLFAAEIAFIREDIKFMKSLRKVKKEIYGEIKN